jgi:hypothetical protein
MVAVVALARWPPPRVAAARLRLKAMIAQWSAPNFPDNGFVVNSRCGLQFQIFLVDLLRGSVLKPGVPTLW